jgi:hypothetical protein
MKPCTDPQPILDDWAEALKLAAEMDAAARETVSAVHDPPPRAECERHRSVG